MSSQQSASLKTQYPGADVAGAKGPPKGGVPVMPGAGGPSSSPQQNGPPANAPLGPPSPQQQWQNPPHQNWQQGPPQQYGSQGGGGWNQQQQWQNPQQQNWQQQQQGPQYGTQGGYQQQQQQWQPNQGQNWNQPSGQGQSGPSGPPQSPPPGQGPPSQHGSGGPPSNGGQVPSGGPPSGPPPQQGPPQQYGQNSWNQQPQQNQGYQNWNHPPASGPPSNGPPSNHGPPGAGQYGQQSAGQQGPPTGPPPNQYGQLNQQWQQSASGPPGGPPPSGPPSGQSNQQWQQSASGPPGGPPPSGPPSGQYGQPGANVSSNQNWQQGPPQQQQQQWQQQQNQGWNQQQSGPTAGPPPSSGHQGPGGPPPNQQPSNGQQYGQPAPNQSAQRGGPPAGPPPGHQGLAPPQQQQQQQQSQPPPSGQGLAPPARPPPQQYGQQQQQQQYGQMQQMPPQQQQQHIVHVAPPQQVPIGQVGPWQVTITLVRIHSLPKMDLIGKCDGFVRMTHGALRQDSPVKKKDYNPVFNHTFPTCNVDTFGAPILLEVFDWDRTGSNDFIGKMEFHMIDLVKMGGPAAFSNNTFILDQTLPLPNAKKAPTRVVLRINIMWPASLHAMNPVAKGQWWNRVENDKIHVVLKKWKINDTFHMDLMSLAGYDVVMVLDDSGSMQSRVDGTSKTRWDELKEVAKIALSIGVALDPDGIDIIFLNRPGADRVQDPKLVEDLFRKPPSGTTPLTKACKDAFSRKTPGKPMICLIATDGAPNNLKAFTETLRTRDPQIFLGILACSDNDRDVGYLNKLDKELDHCDVLDDYKSEKAEVKHIVKFANYTLGDHGL